MHKLDISPTVHPTSGLLRITEEEYLDIYKRVEGTGALLKFNTKIACSEGMWAIFLDQKGIDLVQDSSSFDVPFQVIVANDSVLIPPMRAGTIVTLITQGTDRPKLCREAFIKQVTETLDDASTLTALNNLWDE